MNEGASLLSVALAGGWMLWAMAAGPLAEWANDRPLAAAALFLIGSTLAGVVGGTLL